ncbi:MAG: GNAT family N-acetyltransferase [Chitinophagaceae bacterium]
MSKIRIITEKLTILKTDRLVLRPLKNQDEQEIYFLRSDPQVNEYLVAPIAKNIDDAWAFIQKIISGYLNNECTYWGITLKTDDKLIGTICIWNIDQAENKAEVGYVLRPAFQKKGLMQEALSKVIEYGFTVMKLQALDAVLHPDNINSARLLEKNGFVRAQQEGNEVFYKLINEESH